MNIIRYENEGTHVDFKREQYHHIKSLLRDIIARANANTEASKRYIIIGVMHLSDGKREYFSIPRNEFKDNADYQSLVRQNIEPEIKFSYKPFELVPKWLESVLLEYR
ncbi:RNA-binding domain-containing protein [Paenibacillus wulumuqiensis]|uniref:RNA-binding domain-containing protein n=1 Tax=Paenibacillus wulumuqiensis TaxID=1567107 RepID=UPI0006196857|nr:RNA-binding domain-containing protein [Paenibacillus wulumuqiensis]